jgi:hypothetical protein
MNGYRISVGKPGGGDVGEDGKIILKLILEK